MTWGKPTPKGLIKLETFSLVDIKEIRLLVDDKVIDTQAPPEKGRSIELEFIFSPEKSVRVPFTEIPLAAQWGKHLQQELQRVQES
jgi:hypothetical protein